MTTDELRHDLHAYNDDATIPTRTAKALLAALDVVEQARNMSPRICGAAMVLHEKIAAFDAALAGEST